MRRIVNSSIIIIACLMLISCGKEAIDPKQPESGIGTVEPTQQIDNREIVQINSSGNYGIYDMSGQFIKKVNNNLIDSDYNTDFKELNQSKDFSTNAQLELELKYIKIWDTELNTIYNKLQTKLNLKENEELIESQKGWLKYHMKESELVKQVFYLRDSGQILGSQGKIQIQQAIKGRLRERTLELMEYYSMLGNNVEFVYKGVNN